MTVALQVGVVTEDATLDAFSTETGERSDANAEDAASETGSASGGADAAEPVAPTSSWQPDGECAACGEQAARRWRDGDERVCGSCVAWTATGGDARDQ